MEWVSWHWVCQRCYSVKFSRTTSLDRSHPRASLSCRLGTNPEKHPSPIGPGWMGGRWLRMGMHEDPWLLCPPQKYRTYLQRKTLRSSILWSQMEPHMIWERNRRHHQGSAADHIPIYLEWKPQFPGKCGKTGSRGHLGANGAVRRSNGEKQKWLYIETGKNTWTWTTGDGGAGTHARLSQTHFPVSISGYSSISILVVLSLPPH